MEPDGPIENPMEDLFRKGITDAPAEKKPRNLAVLAGLMLVFIVICAIVGVLVLGGLGHALVDLYYAFLRWIEKGVEGGLDPRSAQPSAALAPLVLGRGLR